MRLAIALALVLAAGEAAQAQQSIGLPLSEQGEIARRAGRLADAFRLQREGAERGEPRAQWLLSKMYALGVGTAKNQERAEFWKRKAAELGEAEAQASVGIDYFELKGAQRDNAQASYWCRQAAEQGDSDAQACMGRLYEEGRGVFRDSARAAEWFRKSAEQRNASGAIGLALLHYSGNGVPRDLVESLKWFYAARDLAAPTVMTMDANPRRIYDDEIRSPQVWIATVQRLVDQTQLDRARQRAQEWLGATPATRSPSRAAAADWLKSRSFCGDSASLALPENEAGLRTLSGTEKLVYQDQALAQQFKFFENGRAVVMQDQQPKFLCTYVLNGQAARLTCPLSTYEIGYVSASEIRIRASGPSALQTAHGLVQRMRTDAGVCKSQN